MKFIYSGLAALTIAAALSACGEFEPTGYESIPDLPTAVDIRAEVGANHVINVSWALPASSDITDVLFIRDADNANPVHLGPDATSYQIKGAPMGEECVYTVKICYGDKYVSPGVSAVYTLPVENLAGVSDLNYTVSGRKVTLTWNLPSADGVTGVRIITNGDDASAVDIEKTTEYTLKAQPMDVDLTYTVEALYDTYYPSEGVSVSTKIPFITPKMGFVMTAPTIDQLPDDDEIAAATWFIRQENAELIQADRLATIDADVYSVLWIMIDRVGLEPGWQNLPAEVSSPEAIEALRNYSANGGSLYLSNMATQLTAPLGIVPDDMAPTVFSSGNGGSGDDVWTINPQLGKDFENGGDQDFYDRTEHEIYKGLEFSDPNNWGLIGLPLIGPGIREDHNCLWDCNLYGKGEFNNVIKHFESVTGSLVLATWGHVRDHCVAGLVDFFATPAHGRCVANGFAAYEWNQNSGTNIYQHNVEQLTLNILNYLK